MYSYFAKIVYYTYVYNIFFSQTYLVILINTYALLCFIKTNTYSLYLYEKY